jgi:uncharacterized membrane protein YphA (DoxX/SURF4 family)
MTLQLLISSLIVCGFMTRFYCIPAMDSQSILAYGAIRNDFEEAHSEELRIKFEFNMDDPDHQR